MLRTILLLGNLNYVYASEVYDPGKDKYAKIKFEEFSNEVNSITYSEYDILKELQYKSYKVNYSDLQPNSGISFKFKVNHGPALLAERGKAYVHIYNKNGVIRSTRIKASYGHSTLSLSPSVSFPPGGGFSFSIGVSEAGFGSITLN